MPLQRQHATLLDSSVIVAGLGPDCAHPTEISRLGREVRFSERSLVSVICHTWIRVPAPRGIHAKPPNTKVTPPLQTLPTIHMDDDEDFGGDIEDAEFIAIATQAEQQFLSSGSNRPPSQTANNHLPNGFDIDDIDFEESSFSSFSQAPPRGNLRQTTLFGSSQVASSGAQSQQARRTWPLANAHSQEKPTHHKINLEAAKTWVYPVNVSYRDYQFNIVRRALLSNVLCALPTGRFWRPPCR